MSQALFDAVTLAANAEYLSRPLRMEHMSRLSLQTKWDAALAAVLSLQTTNHPDAERDVGGTSTQASQTLTLLSNLADGDTVTVGTKVYTLQDSLTNVDGNVKVGADSLTTVGNLVAAITLGTGSGTKYAAATTANTAATGAAGTATAASQTLSVTGQPSNTQTVTVGATAYQFQTVLTDVDGNVKIGGTVYESLGNLIAHINGAAGAGTKYATSGTAHPTSTAAYGTHVAATGTLTLTGQPGNGETVTLAGKAYTYQTTLTNTDGNVAIGLTAAISLANLAAAVLLGSGSGTAYAAATTANPDTTLAIATLAQGVALGTLTFSGQPSDADTVTIDGLIYTWKNVILPTSGARTVLIGTTGAISYANLKAAIMREQGAGTTYSAATAVHPSVTAASGATTLVVTAKTAGAVGNLIATTESTANATWGAATLASGSDAITVTSAGGNNAGSTETLTSGAWGGATLTGGTTKLVATKTAAAAEGNAVATTETLGSGSWGAATMSGGADKFVATAKVATYPGADGNAVATTETSTHASWGAATMAGGVSNSSMATWVTDPDVDFTDPAASSASGELLHLENVASKMCRLRIVTTVAGVFSAWGYGKKE